MATVLYPTRAGDSTYRNQDLAVALARERGADLLLLYVSNVHFMDHLVGTAHVDIVEAGLDQVGEFLLAMAQERAEKAGIEAATLCLHGSFKQALRDVIREQDITAVVLGHPTHDTALTTGEYISELAQSLRAELGVEVLVVDEGEVVERYQPEPHADDGS